MQEVIKGRWSYRLNDLLNGYIRKQHIIDPNHQPPEEFFCSFWPASIGCKLVRSNLSHSYLANKKSLLYLINTSHVRVKPSAKELIIHMRLGDVLDFEFYTRRGCTIQHGCRYVKPISFYNRLNTKNYTRAIIVSNINFRRYSFSYNNSLVYLYTVISKLQKKGVIVNTRLNMSADDDLLYMAHSHHFVESGGGFSNLVAWCVRSMGGHVIHV